MQIKQSTQFKVPVTLVDASGNAITGITFGQPTVYIQQQAGSSTVKSLVSADWTEIDSTHFPGVYDLRLSTSDTSVVGFLKISVVAPSTILVLGLFEIVANIESDTFSRLGAPAGASIAADIAAVQTSANELVAAMVALAPTAASGSTASVVRSTATQPDNFFNGMLLVVVHSSGVAARLIETYANTNGAFTLTSALPFTPSAADQLYVVAQNPAGVWDALRTDHSATGSFGEGVGSVQGNVTGSVGSVTGAVGSVTGNVGGSVGSVATGGITAASLATSALQALGVAASPTVGTGSTTSVVNTNATQPDNFYNGMTLVVVHSSGVAARVIKSYANASGAFTLVSALPFTPSNTDQAYVLEQDLVGIWDELDSNHTTAGTFGLDVTTIKGLISLGL